MKIMTYGTLKKNKCNSPILDNQEYLGKCKTKLPKYKMYEVKGGNYPYPALVEVEEDGLIIEGELYDVSPKCLEYLDRLEGVEHGLYSRNKSVVIDEKDQEHDVEIYCYLRDVSEFKLCGSKW